MSITDKIKEFFKEIMMGLLEGEVGAVTASPAAVDAAADPVVAAPAVDTPAPLRTIEDVIAETKNALADFKVKSILKEEAAQLVAKLKAEREMVKGVIAEAENALEVDLKVVMTYLGA